jgi:predicted dehydrogenase
MEKTLTVGIVGYGMSATVFHLPFVTTLPGYRLGAIVSRSGAHHVRTQHPSVAVYQSYSELLQDPSIDLVVITTPNETHFPFAAQALQAGKHVVLEKPFTNTTDEASQLIDIAHHSGHILSVYQNRRYVSDFLTIRQLLAQNKLGPIHEYECHFDRYRPEAKAHAWREEDKPGSGILFDLGSHLLDQALCLFGLPTTITADIRRQRPHARVDDYFDIRLDFGFAKVILKSSMLVREMGPRYMVHGTLGSYIKHGDDPQEALLKEGVLPVTPDWGREPDSIMGLLHTEEHGKAVRKYIPSLPGNFGGYYTNLYHTITAGAPLSEKPEHGYNTIRLIELAFESNEQQRTLPCTGLLNVDYPGLS